MYIGQVGPYTLELATDLPLDSDIQASNRPPTYHLSWLAKPGIAFAIQVDVDFVPASEEEWHDAVASVQSQVDAQFQPGSVDDIDGAIGPGITLIGRRLAQLARFERPAVIEHYIGRVGRNVLELTYRFHAEHIAHAETWRRLFHALVYGAVMEAPEAEALVDPETPTRRTAARRKPSRPARTPKRKPAPRRAKKPKPQPVPKRRPEPAPKPKPKRKQNTRPKQTSKRRG